MLSFVRLERCLNSLENSTALSVLLKNETIILDRLNSPYFSHREMTVDFNGHGLSKTVIFENNRVSLFVYNGKLSVKHGYITIINDEHYHFKNNNCYKRFICVDSFQYRQFILNNILERLEPIRRLLPIWLFNSHTVATFIWNFEKIEKVQSLHKSETIYPLEEQEEIKKIEWEDEED